MLEIALAHENMSTEPICPLIIFIKQNRQYSRLKLFSGIRNE